MPSSRRQVTHTHIWKNKFSGAWSKIFTIWYVFLYIFFFLLRILWNMWVGYETNIEWLKAGDRKCQFFLLLPQIIWLNMAWFGLLLHRYTFFSSFFFEDTKLKKLNKNEDACRLSHHHLICAIILRLFFGLRYLVVCCTCVCVCLWCTMHG